VDAAEAYLRERAVGSTAGRAELIQFLARFSTREAAIEELDRAIAEGDDALQFRSMRAGLRFEAGDRQEAIDELQALVDEAEASDDRRRIQVALAKMLSATGNEVGARAIVEEVLEEDASNTEALKMQAGWLIAQDETDAAIVALRRALDQSPRDPDTLTLMAAAHERSGSRELMGEMLSLAVEASNAAPEETLRYVRFLMSDGKLQPAETTLVEALRIAPNDVRLLRTLGGLYVEQRDWSRVQQVVETLERIGTDEANVAANELQAGLLAAQDRTDDVVSFLEELVQSGEGGLGAQVAILRTYIQNGNIDAARIYLERAREEDPGNVNLRFLEASLNELEGDSAAAETVYTEILEERPNAVLAWRALYLLQMRTGREAEAMTTLDTALEANPTAGDLLWAKASILQKQGEDEEALAIYEQLYDAQGASLIVANNFASLLSTLRDDEESLARAYSIARRLRNSPVPAFQDTYGWIAFRRGDLDEALAHLEPAAAGLPEDALTQYHLGKLYAELDRADDARAQLEKALQLAEGGPALPQWEDARAQIEALDAAAPAE
jgi:Flp pilus assembly protein TadD